MLFEPAAFLEPISLQRIPKRTRHDVALMCGEVLDKQIHLDPGGGLPAESERQANQQVGDAVAEVAADLGVGLDRAPGKVEAAEIGQRAVSRGQVPHHVTEIAGIVQTRGADRDGMRPIG